MRHFMIDIETLDTRKSAIVLSLACVEFNHRGPLIVDGEVSSIECNLFTKEQLAADRTMSLDTIEWWMDYGSRYPKHNRVHPTLALSALQSMILDDNGDDFIVWAKPPSFDLTILESLFETYGMTEPWKHFQCRDVRTEADHLTTEEKQFSKSTNMAEHNALADCLEQINLLRLVWEKKGYPYT